MEATDKIVLGQALYVVTGFLCTGPAARSSRLAAGLCLTAGGLCLTLDLAAALSAGTHLVMRFMAVSYTAGCSFRRA